MYFRLKYCAQGFLFSTLFTFRNEADGKSRRQWTRHFNVSQMLLKPLSGVYPPSQYLFNLIQADLRKWDEGLKFICAPFQPHLSWHHEIHPEQHQRWLRRNWSLPAGVHLAPYLGNQSHRPKHFPRRLSLKDWQPAISPHFWEDREWRLFVICWE